LRAAQPNCTNTKCSEYEAPLGCAPAGQWPAGFFVSGGECMARVQAFSYASAQPGKAVAAWLWLPRGSPKAIIQIVHGMCEYTNRYSTFCEALCGRGFAVCGSDLLGHGQTARLNRDPLGWFGARGQARTLVQDVHRMTAEARRRLPGLPVVLVCHSMGSFVGRLCLALYPADYAGAALLGTAGPRLDAVPGRWISAQVCRAAGARHVSPLLQGFFAGGRALSPAGGPTGFDWVCGDRGAVRSFLSDPMCNFVYTAAAAEDIFDLMDHCSRPQWYRAVPKDLPILLASGRDDPVGGWGRGVERVFCALRRTGHTRVTLRLWPGARHELLHDFSRAAVFRCLLQWIQSVIDTTSKE